MKHTPNLKPIETAWKPNDPRWEIERLNKINKELLEACNRMLKVFGNPNSSAEEEVDAMTQARQAIRRAEEGRE